MLYKVRAKIHVEKMKLFFTALVDGSIADQEPDGAYIVNSMQKALMEDNETIVWYESCQCTSALKHERETVYDTYLYDITATKVSEIKDDIKGKSFWEYMEGYYDDDTYTY